MTDGDALFASYCARRDPAELGAVFDARAADLLLLAVHLLGGRRSLRLAGLARRPLSPGARQRFPGRRQRVVRPAARCRARPRIRLDRAPNRVPGDGRSLAGLRLQLLGTEHGATAQCDLDRRGRGTATGVVPGRYQVAVLGGFARRSTLAGEVVAPRAAPMGPVPVQVAPPGR